MILLNVVGLVPSSSLGCINLSAMAWHVRLLGNASTEFYQRILSENYVYTCRYTYMVLPLLINTFINVPTLN